MFSFWFKSCTFFEQSAVAHSEMDNLVRVVLGYCLLACVDRQYPVSPWPGKIQQTLAHTVAFQSKGLWQSLRQCCGLGRHSRPPKWSHTLWAAAWADECNCLEISFRQKEEKHTWIYCNDCRWIIVLVFALRDVLIIVLVGDGDNVFVICLHDSCVCVCAFRPPGYSRASNS